MMEDCGLVHNVVYCISKIIITRFSLFMMAFPDTYLITLYRLQMMALFGGAMKGD